MLKVELFLLEYLLLLFIAEILSNPRLVFNLLLTDTANDTLAHAG